MSQLVDMLNPARTFDLGAGRVCKYREASLLAVEDALRQGLVEQTPELAGKELDDKVDACLSGGDDDSIPAGAIARVILYGLAQDDPDVTLAEVKSLFTAGLTTTMVGLCTAIMGIAQPSGEPVAEGAEAAAEGNAEAGQAPA